MVSDFQLVIGIEVHAQLLTRSKIFCGCPTAFGGEPNTHVCPVCLGMPGVLPALNRQVVEFAVRTGLALGCAIQEKSVFARKNYFYPDLPKGYQVSQYELPICLGGGVDFTLDGADRLRQHGAPVKRVQEARQSGSAHRTGPGRFRRTHDSTGRPAAAGCREHAGP